MLDSASVTSQPDQSADAGTPAQAEFQVQGMTCSNCVRRVTEAIQSVPGVSSALVALENGHASVRWAAGVAANVPAILQAVASAGYRAEPVKAAAHAGAGHAAHRQAGWQVNLWLGVLGTVPLMLGEWVFQLGPARWFQWASFALASVVQVFAGAPFYRGAWNQLKAGRSNMDTLVALGSTTAFGYSVWALWAGAWHLYFMEAAAIITLISVGHWLEARAGARAASALKALLHLAPSKARRRQADGTEMEVPVAELRPDDLVALKPGDRVPTDGQVTEGESAVDESMLTGESAPVDKAAGKPLYAGTVNLNGRLLMRVTATGEATALAHIIAAVQRAQSSRANIQRLGDRVSSVFVPTVVLVAIAAGLWWGFRPEQARGVSEALSNYLWEPHVPATPLAAAFITAAAVLIIACPCAMGLATPAAIMAGSNAAARRGILIRDGVALEKAGRISAVVFDKTGTLTEGKPTVVATARFEQRGLWAIVISEGPSSSEALELAAALARHSNHPLSQAVARLAVADHAFSEWHEFGGAGLAGKASINDGPLKTIRLGSLRWLREIGVDLSVGERFAEVSTERGATVLGVAVDQSLAAMIAIVDTVKPGARQVVRQLSRQGLETYLLTGDNRRTAVSIARQAGIPSENVFADVRPEGKAAFVQRLQNREQRVAFVGDGINDAPALEQADLGIAVSRASDIAREAADVILLNSELDAVPESLGLARATLRTIKQNLFWAFFYNAIGVPLAALGFMSPVLCAAAMGLSDLIVIGNALRLRHWKLSA